MWPGIPTFSFKYLFIKQVYKKLYFLPNDFLSDKIGRIGFPEVFLAHETLFLSKKILWLKRWVIRLFSTFQNRVLWSFMTIYSNTRNYPLRRYILGVITLTTAWDQHCTEVQYATFQSRKFYQLELQGKPIVKP